MTLKNQIMPGAQPQYLSGNKTGIILIHGFTGAPPEMSLLGNFLNNLGYTVLIPRLFGHGTQVADINRAHWEDWVASVEDAYAMLQTSCDKIILAGLSMGGALALYTASYLDVAGVIAMSAPYSLPGSVLEQRLMPLIKLLSYIKPYRRYQPIVGNGWYQPELAVENISYIGYTPLAASYELDQLLEMSKNQLQHITAPTLLMHSKKDETVPYEHMAQIKVAVGEAVKKVVTFEKSGHILPMDGEREQVFYLIQLFLQQHC